MIGGASVRGCKAADYSCKTSTCEGQKLGVGPKSPSSPLPWFRRPCTTLYNYYLFAIAYKKVYKNCFCICYDARQLRSLQLTNYITVYCLQTSVTMIHKHPLHKINFFYFYLAYLAFFFTSWMHWEVLLTAPSVRRNSCLKNPGNNGCLKMCCNAVSSSVPPRSAWIF